MLILADDLTGAADCAARCRQAGLPAAIHLRPPPPCPPRGAVAFTSDSRHLAPAAAAARVRAAVRELAAVPNLLWYKKIDSTLRGNLGAELDAMLATLNRCHAIVCPAFPAQRRGLFHGQLVLDPPRADPLHLPSLLKQQSAQPVASIDLFDLRAGAAALARQLDDLHRRGVVVIVVDALTDADLATLVMAGSQALPDALWCGSAGLVGALARLQGQRSPAALSEPVDTSLCAAGDALLVIGSASPVARRQVQYLAGHHVVRVVDVAQVRAFAPGATGDVVLHLPPPAPDLRLDGPEARHYAGQLADAALVVLARQAPGLLVLSGGDTAIAVLERLGVAELVVLRELLPGMPLARAVLPDRVLSVVLKAGNHGDDATLAELLRLARCR